MKIISANKEYAKEISKLMLKDLENPNPKFSKEMILGFKEHAKEENILKELNNPNTIGFLAINSNLKGFIVGYKEDANKAVIHYITANSVETKRLLLKEFIKKCKKKGISLLKTDTFEFMENNEFFKNKGFIFTKKESISPDLEMLWYKFKI